MPNQARHQLTETFEGFEDKQGHLLELSRLGKKPRTANTRIAIKGDSQKTGVACGIFDDENGHVLEL